MIVTRKRLRAAESRIEALEAEQRGYTEVVTNALLEAATDTASNAYVAGLEIAAGQLSRAFISARVDGPGMSAFNPVVMASIGRRLVESGEAVYYREGRRFTPASEYNILPSGQYQLTFTSMGLTQRQVIFPPERVFHVRWNFDLTTRRGISPLSNARTLRTLMQRLENALATESNAAIGYLLPVPSDGQSKAVEQLKQDLQELNGRIAVIETTRGGWGEGGGAAPRRDFELARMGPAYPDGNVELFSRARDTILAACGYPVSLMDRSDGTAQREGWRRYLHGTVAPLGRLVETESARIGLPVTLDWDALFASDVQGRARAFQSLVQGGMPLEAAAAASGILIADEDTTA